jgi:hypothetical protein
MALTATDLDQIKEVVTDVVTDVVRQTAASKDDLKKFATKVDLARMEARLTSAMGILERDSLSRLDDHEIRIQRLESSQGSA